MGKFGKKPMHFFGAIGTLMFILGFALVFYMVIHKLFFDQGSRLLAQRTEFFVAITAMIMGVQFFLAGFLAELSTRNAPHRNVYLVEKEI
jgi:hypothetical protein